MSSQSSTMKTCFRCNSHLVGMVHETEFYDMDEEEFGGENVYMAVTCTKCGIVGPFRNNSVDAIEAWNLRAENGPVVTEVSKKTVMVSS